MNSSEGAPGDCELMMRAKAGDDSAFAVLVERYGKILLNFFLRKSVSYEDGQDLAQRTFLRLWRYRGRYSPSAKFTTFLFLLAGQVAVDHFRDEARRKRLADTLAGDAADAEATIAAESPDPGSGDDVRAAVSRLPQGLRDVVELGVFQQLQYADISEILGIPKGTVKSRMFNALRRLKEILS